MYLRHLLRSTCIYVYVDVTICTDTCIPIPYFFPPGLASHLREPRFGALHARGRQGASAPGAANQGGKPRRYFRWVH